MRWSAAKDAKLRAMPEGFIDPMLKTITFARAGQPIVRLHYYATHPQSFYHDRRVSWDVPGIARQRLEKKEGVFQIYFNGCAGDIVMGKYNDGTRRARAELAERLYAGMEASAAATRLEPIGPFQWRSVEVSFTPRTDGKYAPEKNLAVMKDPQAAPRKRCYAALRLACAERLTRPVVLGALRIGDVHIVHLPGEPMVTFQKYAQATRAGEFVAVAGYGLGSTGYLCPKAAFAQGGYEPTASAVVPESEAVLKKAIRQLLGTE